MPDPKPFVIPPPADPRIGYTVTRRPDGGMHYVFTQTDRATVEHWREFALRHLDARIGRAISQVQSRFSYLQR